MKRNYFAPARTAVGAASIRARTLDVQTFDSSNLANAPLDAMGNQRGKSFDHAYKTHDGKRTVDSTGAFLIGELERLDQTLNMPLAAVTWSRDVDLREDVSLADEVSSFTLTTFGSAGNLGAGNGIRNGKAWIGKDTNQIGGVGVDTGKFPNPLTPWGLEVKFTLLELESAAKMGRPIDDQKVEALKLKHQMDTDEQVYVGDASISVGGLVNSALVTNITNLPNGALASPLWANKTPDEILKDVNEVLQSAWAASGYAVMPSEILLPPTQFGYISTKVISTGGSTSILKYLLDNNIVTASGKGSIKISPAKWLVGAGAGGTKDWEGSPEGTHGNCHADSLTGMVALLDECAVCLGVPMLCVLDRGVLVGTHWVSVLLAIIIGQDEAVGDDHQDRLTTQLNDCVGGGHRTGRRGSDCAAHDRLLCCCHCLFSRI